MCEVICCSGAGVTNRSRSGASYTLGVKTMNNGWGKVTKGTQSDRTIWNKSDSLATKGTACGSVKNHVVETGLSELVRDVVRCVEGDK